MGKLDELMTDAREVLTVRRVFGEPYEKNGVTFIPAAAVRGGGGGGGGNGFGPGSSASASASCWSSHLEYEAYKSLHLLPNKLLSHVVEGYCSTQYRSRFRK